MQRTVRGILATVKSLVRRTAQSAESVEDYEQHLDGRLMALARSQTRFMIGSSPTCDLAQIVREELLSVLEREGERVIIAGDTVNLPQRFAETFTLAIHELLTNAIKFGALSDRQGALSISWHASCDEGETVLDFYWIEHNGDCVSGPPKRHGFGWDLLENVMRYEHDADPRLEIGAEGLRYSVKVVFASPHV